LTYERPSYQRVASAAAVGQQRPIFNIASYGKTYVDDSLVVAKEACQASLDLTAKMLNEVYVYTKRVQQHGAASVSPAEVARNKLVTTIVTATITNLAAAADHNGARAA
jgi:hypothetical protein